MEDKYRGEKVLVFKQTLLEEQGYFNGTTTEIDHYTQAIFSPENNHFHKRFQAEEDPSLKQIIPYILFCYKDTVFSYVRGKQAGEKRLVGNRSIGIGGHVNPIDEQTRSDSNDVSEDMATYMEAVKREIAEEVIVDGNFDPKIEALLNDDSNPVGKVHFGIIHVCDLDGPNVKRREKQITESGFVKISELAGPRREELESWSQLAIDYLLKRKNL